MISNACMGGAETVGRSAERDGSLVSGRPEVAAGIRAGYECGGGAGV